MTDSSATEPEPATSQTSAADEAAASGQEAGISDDQLPEDLQPGEDNPLAEPLDPDDEATKDQEELGMDETQEDLGNDDGASQAPTQE